MLNAPELNDFWSRKKIASENYKRWVFKIKFEWPNRRNLIFSCIETLVERLVAFFVHVARVVVFVLKHLINA